MELLIQEFVTNRHMQVFCMMSLFIVFDIVVCLFLFFRARNFLRNSVLTTAKIAKIETYKNQKGTRDNLTVQYQDKKGENYGGIVSVVRGTHNGKEIEVLYHQDNPLNMRSNNKLELFVSFMIMLTITIAFTAVLFAVFVKSGVLDTVVKGIS